MQALRVRDPDCIFRFHQHWSSNKQQNDANNDDDYDGNNNDNLFSEGRT